MTPEQAAAVQLLRAQLTKKLAQAGLGLVGQVIQGATSLSKAAQVGCTPCQAKALAALAALGQQGGGR